MPHYMLIDRESEKAEKPQVCRQAFPKCREWGPAAAEPAKDYF
jgi:hypothetical protein